MMQLEQPDEKLASMAAKGDREAFSRLIERHYNTMHRVAWRCCGDADRAEDIAQEVAIKLARAIRSYRGEAAFSTWLYRVVLNTVRDKQRAWSAERRHANAYTVQAAIDAQGEHGNLDAADRLWRAVERLPERQRNSVLLVHGEGMSHGEAAVAMEVSEGTVSFHIHEARNKLRAMMSAPEDELS